jgi:prevent-host-death family protein
MKTASAEEVRAEFDNYLKATAKGPVIVTRNGKPVAVLLSVKDAEEIEGTAISQSKKLRKVLQKGPAQVAKGRGIPEQEFWRQVKRMRRRQEA